VAPTLPTAVERSVRSLQAAFAKGGVEILRGLMTEDHVSTLTCAHFCNVAEPGKKGAVPFALYWLQELSPSFERISYRTARPPLGKVFGRITLCRGQFTGPCFDVEAAGLFAEPPLNSIRERFAEPYHRIFPMELLAYHELQPILTYTGWVSRLHTFERSQITAPESLVR
jgi:hypothetical protein